MNLTVLNQMNLKQQLIVALMKEKLEFAVFKLERITDENSQYVTLVEQAAAHHLYTEQ